MPFDVAEKNALLDARRASYDAVGLHDGDPGAGAANEVTGDGYARVAPGFAAASSGEISPAANLEFSGPASQAVSWFTVWAGGTRVGKGEITTGDAAFNAAGEYELTTATVLRIDDPV